MISISPILRSGSYANSLVRVLNTSNAQKHKHTHIYIYTYIYTHIYTYTLIYFFFHCSFLYRMLVWISCVTIKLFSLYIHSHSNVYYMGWNMKKPTQEELSEAELYRHWLDSKKVDRCNYIV